MAKRDAEEVAKGKSASAGFLVAIYAAAELRITEWIRRMRDERSQRRIHATRNRVFTELHSLDRRTPDAVRELIESAFRVGAGEADRLIGDRSGRRPLSAVSTRAASVLIDNLVTDLSQATTVVGRRIDDIFRREGLRAALQVVEFDQPKGVAEDAMIRRLEREGITGFIDKAGRRWKLSTYARMATRTTASEALAQGTAQKMLERGFDVIQVSDHHCTHHPNDPESPCVRLEGGTFSLTGLSSRFERLPSLPPWHPNCTHLIFPSVEAFAPAPLDVVSA